MSDMPISERIAETLDSAVLQLGDDDITRAAAIYQNARDEAGRSDARCAEWQGHGRLVWREPPARAVLHRRMTARVRMRIAYRWLTTQAIGDWRPSDMRGH